MKRMGRSQLSTEGLAFRAARSNETHMLPTLEYPPGLPTGRTKVPSGPDWFHEIKHDGDRLIVQREGKCVRLLTRRGYDWSDRYPLITQAALKLRKSSFVIAGEAVVLGPDGTGFNWPKNGSANARGAPRRRGAQMQSQ